uniref:Fibroblast growth factor n=1 Tax=Caenorhabditis tropicalis TaxID=1561998 RepID=A0A1I7T703_9PELO
MIKKRCEEVKALRQKEKQQSNRKPDPFQEYTSSTYSHMRLVMGNDGRIMVLACNADGKNEKYAFNMTEKKYELVEVINEEYETGGISNYLVKAYGRT